MPLVVTVEENDGTIQVCATLSTPENTERGVSFILASRNGTGLPNVDSPRIQDIDDQRQCFIQRA